MRPELDQYLQPSSFIDSDAPEVVAFVDDVLGGEPASTEQTEQAARLFAAVRDRIWYDPFCVSTDPDAYRASAVATSAANWCVPKAVLLTAAARAAGIPARVGFADVRNHLQTPRLRERMGGADLFVYHGYSDLYLGGRWVKATPAFNAELCLRFGVAPIVFDGRTDALLHQFTSDGSIHMEYERDRGVHTDLPLPEILAAFEATYGRGMFVEYGTENGTESGVDAFTAPAARS